MMETGEKEKKCMKKCIYVGVKKTSEGGKEGVRGRRGDR